MKVQPFGPKILQFREGAGLTQEELAGRAGITVRQIQRIESGKANPKIATLEAVAGALGKSITDLLSSESPQNTRNVYPLRPDPKAAQAMQEAHDILRELAAAPPLLRLSAIYLLTGDEEIVARILALPGGERHARALGKLRAIP